MSSAAGSQSSPPTSSSEAPTSSPDTSTSSSAQPTSTTNAPATSNTPATSDTAVATPQSSPAGQSTTAGRTTTAPSVSASTTAAAATTTTSSFTSQVPTILSSTDSAGSVVYLTTSVPEVITTSISTTNTTSSSSSSHTGVIVGAVVGGVAGITILALLLFCIRKRVRKDEFDGNFDPDHVVGRIDGGGGTLPRVDLAEDVTPFPQSYVDQGSSSMRQYGQSPYVGAPSSLAASGQTSPDLYSSVDAQSRQFVQHGLPPAAAYVPPVNMYGSPGEWHGPHPGASPPPSTSSYTSSSRGAKEREALGRIGQGLGLATQPETAEGASADVVVHQDAGRAPIEDHSSPKEIPPAYESIPQD